MKKLYSFIATMVISIVVFGQVSLTTLNTAYTQNFDGLASTGTGTGTVTTTGTSGSKVASVILSGSLSGWYFVETTTNADGVYTASTGSATAGDTYSYGASSSTERALGSIASGNVLSRYGALFSNNTGITIV